MYTLQSGVYHLLPVCARYTLQSGVYHLLPLCQVYTAVWCVSSATTVPGIHCSLVCTICYHCARYILQSEWRSWHQSAYYIIFKTYLSISKSRKMISKPRDTIYRTVRLDKRGYPPPFILEIRYVAYNVHMRTGALSHTASQPACTGTSCDSCRLQKHSTRNTL